ncbi:DUF3800 domain-containing protein [Gracilimonas amylolytica]|uniref:DUF3800 domain-containing protein n=1 Tax=Gracilimonas amylolytica TaxID=1749045 RepID=UPI0018E4804D|nr:DUF3800 domain-containing protein [Gracilimonas amylolytica]
MFNIYCDESCHLENDHISVMILGALWFPINKKEEIFQRLKEIKQVHGLPAHFEIKWNKVSPAKSRFYLDLVDYFFDDDDLHYRALIVPDKNELDHDRYDQDHDDFYYKMYFDLLKVILDPESGYNIYLDIKDTLGWEKVEKLSEVLQNNHYDYSREIVQKVQQVHSDKVIPLQLADLLTGAIGYHNRGLKDNQGKVDLVNRIIKRSGYNLTQTTLLRETKFNLFRWKANYYDG